MDAIRTVEELREEPFVNMDDTEEITSEEVAEQLMPYEGDILSALVTAANFRNSEDEIVRIEIARGGLRLFSFRIHPLSEGDYMKCRERNTRFVKSRSVGVRIPEKVNNERYRNELIYIATVDEDRAKVWNNKDAWRRLGVANGIDLIGVVLKAGEKDAICDKLDKISGYNEEDIEEETIKN